jgi:hypothetical protein
MVPYEEARPFSKGIGKYTKPEEEIRLKSGRQDTGRQYVARKPVTVGWEPDLPAIRRGVVLDPFCGTATAGEVALKLGRHFIGIELYENHAQIAADRCRQAHLLRSEHEAENPMTQRTPSFDEILNDTMPDEVQFGFDFDAGVPWEATSCPLLLLITSLIRTRASTPPALASGARSAADRLARTTAGLVPVVMSGTRSIRAGFARRAFTNGLQPSASSVASCRRTLIGMGSDSASSRARW